MYVPAILVPVPEAVTVPTLPVPETPVIVALVGVVTVPPNVTVPT